MVTSRDLVFDLMRDGAWRTLEVISEATGLLPTGVAARLRELRNPAYGGYKVEKRKVTPQVYEYRLLS